MCFLNGKMFSGTTMRVPELFLSTASQLSPVPFSRI